MFKNDTLYHTSALKSKLILKRNNVKNQQQELPLKLFLDMNDDFLIHGICHWILKFVNLPAYACCCVLTVALLSDLKCVTIQRNSPDSIHMAIQDNTG